MSRTPGSLQDSADLDVADLESVLFSTHELSQRPSRPRDYAAENRALVALVDAMTAAPNDILQYLAETALDLCRAGSAGLSLLDAQQKRFRWAAIAGQWASHLGGGTPRDFGPCGVVLDRNAALLFSRPERHFRYLASAKPYMEEGLLIPFYVGGKAVSGGRPRCLESPDNPAVRGVGHPPGAVGSVDGRCRLVLLAEEGRGVWR